MTDKERIRFDVMYRVREGIGGSFWIRARGRIAEDCLRRIWSDVRDHVYHSIWRPGIYAIYAETKKQYDKA